MLNGPAQVLPHAAARFADKTALITVDRTLTFAELESASNRVAGALHARGIEPGQTVSLYSQNRWEWLVAYHGALKIGAVVNPINVMLTTDEVAYVLRDACSAAVFVGEDQAEKLVQATTRIPQECSVIVFGSSAVPGTVAFRTLLDAPADLPLPQPRLDDACTIGYTSGTTGHPKGAVQSNRAVIQNFGLTATMHGRTAEDIVVTALPAPHVYGNVAVNSTWLVGGTVVLMERFDPVTALELIGDHRATMFEGVPAMYAAMLADAALDSADLSSLTRSTVGGQTMPEATIARWEQRSGAPLIELWGMTELAGLGTTHPLHAQGPKGSIGVPLPGMEVRLVDLRDPAREAAEGEAGELLIRGPVVMKGYFDNDAATREVLDDAGWLRTGDVARRDENGFLFIVDRLKDMIITGGYNIYPAEIERVLSAHPGVAMVGVGAVPDETKGELACAYVVRANGSEVTEHEIIEFSAQHLAAYKRPRMVRFVGDLPKTSSGKIMRRKLITSLDVDIT
ncbi:MULTISPECIES: class I adenylate-forming enzyme family protein [unclassified Rhodococcus (in: high G+C Gram-positive bacteria)]|uniref:class I adenylate-forming enzyme family protein n=1 Tax=unclassified Rhodococcus (in: high G+C Gram-positive bacteria) TaxID=192944 RepID=UPI000925F14E|nr:AMP-binding protein [Rhodococcus sp. M8]OLL20921.1 fatty-acid--CoA ligase [Rhodococcus sp. M8]QPG44768.1 AMP-binding protein [Rhodococcus sp. M8]